MNFSTISTINNYAFMFIFVFCLAKKHDIMAIIDQRVFLSVLVVDNAH